MNTKSSSSESFDGINHRIGIKASIDKVFSALTTEEGLSGWWTKAKGASQVGSKIDFVFPQNTIEIKVLSLTSNKQVVWKGVGFPPPWKETTITFNLKHEGDFTILLFSHKGWSSESYEVMAHSSTKWAYFLLSLKLLLEDGKGTPAPHDRKIDNWN